LRERLEGLSRADVVALSRAETASREEREAIRARVQQLAPRADWMEVAHQPGSLLSSKGELREVAPLVGQRVVAFCGIGNPAGFRHTVQSCGCELVDFREFPDHHPFLDKDVADLEAWADGLENVATILCTHKDLVKINRPQLGPHSLWALTIRLDIDEGKDRLESRLRSLLPG
jgi:tetraacyldisaccharide 4'-kinase